MLTGDTKESIAAEAALERARLKKKRKLEEVVEPAESQTRRVYRQRPYAYADVCIC
jgi:hypothetical protein